MTRGEHQNHIHIGIGSNIGGVNRIEGKKAGDAYVSNPYVDEPKTILDVTISCPTCPTYICDAAATSNDHCTKLAEKNKHTKYDDLAASKLDCRVVAAAFTT